MKNIISIFFALLFLATACKKMKKRKNTLPREGVWRAEIKLKEGWLPFNFKLSYEGNAPLMSIENGEELIAVEEMLMTNDSLIVKMPVYHSEIHLTLADDSMQGEWWYLSKGRDYRLPFRAVYGADYRFLPDSALQAPAQDISGKWKTIFNPGDSAREELAMGVFHQEGNKLKGTFDSPTGDYRYLEGIVSGDSLYLSEFDGAFAYLFKAKIGDTIQGILYSGKSGVYPWIAYRDEEFTLPTPENLTRLREGEDQITHTFTDMNGNPVRLQDERFRGKVLVVEVMGTWCPNCKDEARLLAELYEKYKGQGLEIVSLAYERTGEFEKERDNIQHVINGLNLPYPVWFAGKIGDVESQIPIKHLRAYPTTFFIDRNEKIRKIHTGFSGPATGEAFDKTKQIFDQNIKELLRD